MSELTHTHDAVDVRDGYEAVEYTIDFPKSDDPEYGRKVERLVNDTTIEVYVTGSDAVLYECQRCGHRHTGHGIEGDDLKSANTRATCSECGVAGGTTHDDHRVIGIKLPDGQVDEDTDEADEPEIVADGGEDASEHVDDVTIEDAIAKHDAPDHPDATTVEEVRDALAWVQRSMEEIWRDWLSNIENGESEVVYEDRDVIVFATGEQNIPRRDLREHYDGDLNERTPDVVSAIHHELARDVCDYDWGYEYPLVVWKREGIEDGERYVEAVVNGLCARDLSPGQAWAYYGVKIRGSSRNQWAARMGYEDHSAVSEAVRKAERKLP